MSHMRACVCRGMARARTVRVGLVSVPVSTASSPRRVSHWHSLPRLLRTCAHSRADSLVRSGQDRPQACVGDRRQQRAGPAPRRRPNPTPKPALRSKHPWRRGRDRPAPSSARDVDPDDSVGTRTQVLVWIRSDFRRAPTYSAVSVRRDSPARTRRTV